MNLGRKRLSVLFTTFLYFVVFSISATEAYAPPFFKITYQNNVSYLLGSVHVGKPDFYPFPKLIEKQLNHADAIVIEAIPSAADQQLITRYSTLQPQPKIPNSVYKKYCVSRSHFCSALAPFSPWVKATQITMFRLNQQGYQAALGIESYLMSHKGSKSLMELESMEFQLKLMSSLKAKTQQDMLTQAINASDAQITEMFNAWKTGDLKAIDEISQQELQQAGSDEFIKKLLWNRNEAMAKALLDKMKTTPNKLLFVAIGAAHLAGNKSINQYLQGLGAKVENCWKTTKVCQ